MKVVLNHCQVRVAILAVFMLSLAGASIAEEIAAPLSKPLKVVAKQPGLGDHTSEYIRDYLSDPRRSGSLAGSIIGGALSAHPAGPILGSLVGFLVGKQSMFNEDKAKAARASALYVRRDIVPQEGLGPTVPTISFASAQGITFENPQLSVSSPAGYEMDQTPPVAKVFSREQIAAMCSGGSAAIDPRFRALCFYSQGS